MTTIVRAAEKNGARKHKQLIVEGELAPTPAAIAWAAKSHPTKVAVGQASPSGRRYAIDRDGKQYRWFCTSNGGSSLADFDSIDAAKAHAEDFEQSLIATSPPRLTAGAPIVPQAPSFADQMAAQFKGFVAKGQALQKDVNAILAKPFPTSKGSEQLDLDQLFESPKNPRQDFDEDDIAGLAESIIKTGGLMVAILCRPVWTDEKGRKLTVPRYEIADGARRYRALQLLAKKKHELGDKALVDVRPLSDAQLAEAFMTADRRKTLNPLEQARGFKNMLETGHTIDTIASTLGISKGTVHGRLKLLELGKFALKFLTCGTLPPALATPIGRYPEKLQEEALVAMLDGDDRTTGEGELWYPRPGKDPWGCERTDKVLIVGLCMEWLQENFTKSLKTTPFDQKAEDLMVPKELWPDRVGFFDKEQVVAPTCGGCPKNSRNMVKEVAGDDTHDSGKAGFCTGLACYQSKWDATLEQLRAKAKETGEVKVLTPAQSAKALRSGHMAEARYAKASEVVHEDPKKRTLGELQAEVNKKLEESEQLRTVIATTEDGQTKMVDKAELLKVLAHDGKKWAKKEQAAAKGYDHAASRRRDEAKRELRRAVGTRVLVAMVDEIRQKGVNLPTLRAMVEASEQYGDPDQEREAFGLKSAKDVDAFIEGKATQNDLLSMLYYRLFQDDFSRDWGGYDDELKRAAAVKKIDLKKLEADEKKKLADPAAADIPGGDDE